MTKPTTNRSSITKTDWIWAFAVYGGSLAALFSWLSNRRFYPSNFALSARNLPVHARLR